MEFDEVLRDLADHLIAEADMKYQAQREWYDFKPFTCQRQALSENGSVFTVKIEFEPSPTEALKLAVARN